MRTVGLALLGVLLISCHTTRMAHDDPRLFADPPDIVKQADAYVLRYRFAEHAFLFTPAARVEDGKLIYFLSATTSTGNPGGKVRLIPIDDPKQLDALKQGGAYWENQDRLIKLEIVDETKSPSGS